MSLILFALVVGAFYAGFRSGHKFATLKALGDGVIDRARKWISL